MSRHVCLDGPGRATARVTPTQALCRLKKSMGGSPSDPLSFRQHSSSTPACCQTWIKEHFHHHGREGLLADTSMHF